MLVETPLEATPGLQRVIAGNGVWYVHQNPVRRPAPRPQPKAAVKLRQVNPVQGKPERGRPHEGKTTRPLIYHQTPGLVHRWPADTAPPKGYGYEFGTGKLIPLED